MTHQLVLQVFIIILISLEDPTGTLAKEFCQLDAFIAQCDNREVVVMERAQLGRMSIGVCLPKSYGHLGCPANVLAELDRKCSGRFSCSFQVTDLYRSNTCPEGLNFYLEANHSCVKVIQPPSPGPCNPSQSPIIVRPEANTEGFLANVFADTDYGGWGLPMCPWLIEALPGQQINISTINFARVPEPKPKGDDENDENNQVPRPKLCYKLANIQDGPTSRPITECVEDGPRLSSYYESSSNQVEIHMSSGQLHQVYFLLKYKVFGCANPKLPAGSWLRRVKQEAVITCNFTDESWHLTCDGHKWNGRIGNCSDTIGSSLSIFSPGTDFPYGILLVVAIGVALGVFFGGILLTLASLYLKRKRNSASNVMEDAAQRSYNIPSVDKHGNVIAEYPYPSGDRAPLPPPPPGVLVGRGVHYFDREPQYQEYDCAVDDGREVFTRPRPPPGTHIYESPKFGRKH